MKETDTAASYQQALDYLYSFIDYETINQPRSAVNYDLRRMDELLFCLGNPHLVGRTIHIAGTKGKGSTAAMLAAVLSACGYKTGLYTSPHLYDIRERIRVDGTFIPAEQLTSIVELMKPQVAAVNKGNRYGQLTTFELLTALGFAYFSRQNVDFQVVEVGLGGRLDATNVVKPEVCVITSIGLDHTEVLGDTLSKIAAEKAGIIKSGVAVVSAPQAPEAAEVIAKVCLEKNASLVRVGIDVTARGLGLVDGGQTIEVQGRNGKYDITIPLLGNCQVENAATAVAALEVLAEKGFAIGNNCITKGMTEVKWPGRFQVIASQPTVILDGAHNPAAVYELIKSLKNYGGSYKKLVLVFGASMDKDAAGMATLLQPLANHIVVTGSKHPRALKAGQLRDKFGQPDIEIEVSDTVSEAYKRAREVATPGELILVTGSLFVVGEVLEGFDKGCL